MKFAEINKMFTDKVAEYINKGYTINTKTMGGSQGEIAKIDLTNGKEIIRIVLDRDYCDFKDAVSLVVGKVTDNVKPNSFNGWATVWNNKLEIIEKQVWYQHNSHKDWFVSKSEEEYMENIHKERMSNTHFNTIHIFDESSKRMVLSFVRRQPKHKTVKASDIKSVRKVTVTSNGELKNRYEVSVKGSTFVLA